MKILLFVIAATFSLCFSRAARAGESADLDSQIRFLRCQHSGKSERCGNIMTSKRALKIVIDSSGRGVGKLSADQDGVHFEVEIEIIKNVENVFEVRALLTSDAGEFSTQYFLGSYSTDNLDKLKLSEIFWQGSVIGIKNGISLTPQISISKD